MAPPKLRISQEAFDALVEENMEEFGMEQEEALEDAITAFTLQGADLTGIMTKAKPAGQAPGALHPVILATQRLLDILDSCQAAVAPGAGPGAELRAALPGLCVAAQELQLACCSGGGGLEATGKAADDAAEEGVQVAVRHGAVEAAVRTCQVALSDGAALSGQVAGSELKDDGSAGEGADALLEASLSLLCFLLTGDDSRQAFYKSRGASTITACLYLLCQISPTPDSRADDDPTPSPSSHPIDSTPTNPDKSADPCSSLKPHSLTPSLSPSPSPISGQLAPPHDSSDSERNPRSNPKSDFNLKTDPTSNLNASSGPKPDSDRSLNPSPSPKPNPNSDPMHPSPSSSSSPSPSPSLDSSPPPGPKVLALLALAAEVAGRAATRFELSKEAFVDGKAHVVLLQAMLRCRAASGPAVRAACEALGAICTADDSRVLASKAFGNARLMAEAGAVEVILECARANEEAPDVLATLCAALKAVAVNDDICKKVAQQGGLALVLGFLRNATHQRDAAMARSACLLLCQLAGSDENKEALALAGGFQVAASAASVFSSNPSVLQDLMALVAALTLRSPSNASRAVQVGLVDVIAEMMEEHPAAGGFQRQACNAIRNLCVRNLENRPIILERGVEALIRKAKAAHRECVDAGSAALRDLGLDNYNA